jgi:hypothetical protein
LCCHGNHVFFPSNGLVFCVYNFQLSYS